MRAVTILSKVPVTVAEPELDSYRYDCLINRLEELVTAEPKYGDQNGYVRVLKSQVSNITRDIISKDSNYGYCSN